MSNSEGNTTYNGWSNYETWNVALWLDNDFDLYSDIRSSRLRTRSDISRYIKGLIDEMTPDLGSSMFSDLLSAALRVVDFEEIADHYMDEEE